MLGQFDAFNKRAEEWRQKRGFLIDIVKQSPVPLFVRSSLNRQFRMSGGGSRIWRAGHKELLTPELLADDQFFPEMGLDVVKFLEDEGDNIYAAKIAKDKKQELDPRYLKKHTHVFTNTGDKRVPLMEVGTQDFFAKKYPNEPFHPSMFESGKKQNLVQIPDSVFASAEARAKKAAALAAQ